MPLYEYRCSSCGAQFDKLVPISNSPSQVVCPSCGQNAAERLISRVASIGSGCESGGGGGGGG